MELLPTQDCEAGYGPDPYLLVLRLGMDLFEL